MLKYICALSEQQMSIALALNLVQFDLQIHFDNEHI